MSSLGNNNQNSFPPYDSYKDCSQGICTIYCPQWCYMIFPPPPFRPQNDDGGGGPNFSPLIIAVIAILASAFLLVSYYTIISKYCRRRNDSTNPRSELDFNIAQFTPDQLHTIAPSGLDESQIKSIPVCKYKKSDGFVDETECSVCLGEFQETEDLRLLPKCSHAFHLNCIDIWLRSNSNCPLCRSVVSFPPQVSVNLVQNQRSDVVLVVDECDRGRVEEVFVGVVSDEFGNLENGNVIQENDQNCTIRRSISMGSFSIGQNLLISDILKIDEDDEDLHCGEFRSTMNRPSSITEDGKGKNQIHEN